MINHICDLIIELAMKNTELSTGSSKIHSISMLVDTELMRRMAIENERDAGKDIVGYPKETK